jgi:hypothetical protein
VTTVSTVATTGARRPRGGLALPVLLGSACLLAGLSLMVTLASGLRDLSANSGQMQHLLALNAPATGELAETLGPAGPGVDNMAFYATLCAAGLAAALLLVAGGMYLSAGHLKHPDAARRVAATGLSVGLLTSLVAMVPLEGGWGQTGIDGIRTGVVVLIGLLLLQISAPQWRNTLREAFRD